MKAVTDQTGRKILLPDAPPQRIVSLVPSQTELLHHLGLRQEVAGITKFCIHPTEWFQRKTRVGGTKQINIPLIHSLQPDLIIANKEENVKEQVEELARHFPVWVSDVNNLPEALEMIDAVGHLVHRGSAAADLVAAIQNGFNSLPSSFETIPACYLIWQNPYMTVGDDTFIHSMLQTAGFSNVFAGHSRYPVITTEDIIASAARFILLSSEPFPFKEPHLTALRQACPEKQVRLVDGELFSWYGSRLLQAPAYFKTLREEGRSARAKW